MVLFLLGDYLCEVGSRDIMFVADTGNQSRKSRPLRACVNFNDPLCVCKCFVKTVSFIIYCI